MENEHLTIMLRRWRQTRTAERAAAAEVGAEVSRLINSGASEAEVARITGLSRTTVRRMVGKEPRRVSGRPEIQSR